MSEPESNTEKIDGGSLEQEAGEITTVFNEASPDYSPDLEWVAMTTDHDTGEPQFVMEAERYIDNDGLDALREAGWEIQYIEGHNHEYDDNVVISIALPVRGGDSR